MYIDLKEAENPKKSSKEKINSLPTISDEDLFSYGRKMATIGGMQDEQADAFEELIARYESAKRDLNDYSEI